MPDRVPSDHPSIDTHRVRVAHHGRRSRRLIVPASVVPLDTVIRVHVADRTRFARPQSLPSEADDASLAGAYETPDAARDPPTGENALSAWLSTHGVGPGESVLLDVIVPDRQYGLRLPGERSVYRPIDVETESLQSIARELDGTD